MKEGGDAYGSPRVASSPVGGGEAGSFHFSSPLDLIKRRVQ